METQPDNAKDLRVLIGCVLFMGSTMSISRIAHALTENLTPLLCFAAALLWNHANTFSLTRIIDYFFLSQNFFSHFVQVPFLNNLGNAAGIPPIAMLFENLSLFTQSRFTLTGLSFLMPG